MTPERVATISLLAPTANYIKDPQILALARDVETRLQSLPGVTAVGFESDNEPMGGNGNTTWLRVVGKPWNGDHNDIADRPVNPTYFSTLGARLLRGRDVTAEDNQSSPTVAIVNETLARKLFPGEDPVGRQVAYVANSKAAPVQIVGVISDMREGALDAQIPPVIYTAFAQEPDRYLSMVVRTAANRPAVLAEMAAAIRQIDPDILTTGAMMMDDRINQTPSVYTRRLAAVLTGGFAGLALLVGVVGLYGVIAYSVGQRTREIGVRVALGANPAAVYALILREAGWLTCAGVLLGAACSIGAARLMKSLLFGVTSSDATILASVATVLALAAVAASFLPARRAAAINPVEALRAE
jgi:predicted permease